MYHSVGAMQFAMVQRTKEEQSQHSQDVASNGDQGREKERGERRKYRERKGKRKRKSGIKHQTC